ncbi:peptide-methionine (R)-S-oxide reductase [Candidatus Heimdallarchaeota archaeon B3_Heim]|nr:MAG: peptide-methionine (R)-S-oxide reductase [Candidatus Heimdallarchaeota archaeon B3_Heim]
MKDKVTHSEKEWREKLSLKRFHILREKGTEQAFSGEFWNHFKLGHYRCAGCETILFSSDTKFESNCGWPSFSNSLDDVIDEKSDTSHEMNRTEVLCKKCGGHLGHVFEDGPKEMGGLRYCINSLSLKFEDK